jgi:hypothetical protein
MRKHVASYWIAELFTEGCDMNFKKQLFLTLAFQIPPPESDMEDDDDDDEDPDNMEGCEFCVHKSCHPGLAGNAFYKSHYNLRDSFCIGRRCEDPAWEDSDEQEVQPEQKNQQQPTQKNQQQPEQVTQKPEQVTQKPEQVTKKPEQGTEMQTQQGPEQPGQVKGGGVAHIEELNTHSSEFSTRVAELSSSPSFQLSSGSSVITRPVTFWRPWEDKDKAAAHLMTPQGRVFRRARKDWSRAARFVIKFSLEKRLP